MSDVTGSLHRGGPAGPPPTARPPSPPGAAVRARGRLRAGLTSRLAWGCLAVTAAALLAVGSVHPPPTTAAGRIAHLESLIRCPACEDLSVAQSDAPSSVTLRREVAAWVREGWSDERIEGTVVARYGQAGLLLPEASGPATALYVVPVGLVGAAAVCLGVVFWRRRRDGRTASSGARAGPP